MTYCTSNYVAATGTAECLHMHVIGNVVHHVVCKRSEVASKMHDNRSYIYTVTT